MGLRLAGLLLLTAALCSCFTEPAPLACTASAGFQTGYRDASTNNSCTEDAADSFIDGYLLGQKLRNIEQALAINSQEVEHLKDQMLPGRSTLSDTELEFQLSLLKQEQQRLSVGRTILQNQADALRRTSHKTVAP
jgi:hypothetical protein